MISQNRLLFLSAVVMLPLTLFFLIQGVVESSALILSLSFFLAGILSFFLFSSHRNLILFLVVALGPLLNFTLIFHGLYFYPVEILLFTYFVLWFVTDFRKNIEVDMQNAGAIFLLLLLIAFLDTLIFIIIKQNLSPGIRLFRIIAIGFYFFVFFSQAYNSKEHLLELFTKILGITTLVTGLFALVQYLYLILFLGKFLKEPYGVFNGSESMAIFLCVSLPFIFFNRQNIENIAWRRLILFSALLGVIVLFFTRSRAGIFAILVVGILSVFFGKDSHSSKRAKNWTIGVLSILALVAIVSILGKSFSYSLDLPNSMRGLAKGFLSSRFWDWKHGIDFIGRSPFFGNGPVSNVYNQYLQFGAQFGVPFLLVALILLFSVLTKSWKILRGGKNVSPYLPGAFFAVVSLLLMSLGESTWGNQFAYLNWFLLALLWALGRQNNSKATP